MSVRVHEPEESVQPLGQDFTFAGYDQHLPPAKVPELHDSEDDGDT